MKILKCPTCQTKIELVTCYCQEPRQIYFCWTCQRHYPIQTK